MPNPRTAFVWKIDFGRLLGQKVLAETNDGTRRRGELTDIKCRELRLFGRDIQLPEAIVLNDDDQDTIPFNWLKSLEVIE